MKKITLLCAIFASVLSHAQNYNYLGSFTSNGTPLYLEEDDVVDQATLNAVALALPEGFPVPDYNPQYISSGYDTDIIVTKTADVWVTFVGEGAGYKNVLGFYTYDINNPPTEAPLPEDITIIFPNVSALYSGGGLLVGNKVRIGTFSPNTGIGWVLLADAWSDCAVGYGRWQLFSNPDFNPEADPDLRNHNVLLSDPENERIILGFEDIRRDYGSCDNDFNDALFYVTANPYEAIVNENLGLITDYTPVTSGNDGGLESHGDLASLIAKRNFIRVSENTAINKKELQTIFQKSNYRASSTDGSLYHYFPEAGFYGTEIPFRSSPEDLLGITNAKEVFSVDYYEKEDRVLAALATVTEGTVYDHSKVICDRLNDSKLLDIRTVLLKGHRIIYSKLERAGGQIEYALTFSVLNNGSSYDLHSLWNIDKYPEGNYKNFQIWGASMPQVCTVANSILNKLSQEKVLKSETPDYQIPEIFISKGRYKNGKIYLEMVNKQSINTVAINANKRETEMASEQNISFNISLSGEYREEVIVSTGKLFDIGLALQPGNSTIYDAMYLADGPWGIDYNRNETHINSFVVTQGKTSNEERDQVTYEVERNMSVSGEILGTANVFRTLLPGDQLLNVDGFKNVSFYIKNNVPVEVILITDKTVNWEDRLTYKIDVHKQNTRVEIALNDFNGLSPNDLVEKVRSVIFSIQGDYQQFKSFDLEIEGLMFTSQNHDVDESTDNLLTKGGNYPNPFRNQTQFKVPFETSKIQMNVFDLSGRMVLNTSYELYNKNAFIFYSRNLKAGFYTYIVTSMEGDIFSGKFIIE